VWINVHVLFLNIDRSKPLIISNGEILMVHR
jgi:hypothetical protein